MGLVAWVDLWITTPLLMAQLHRYLCLMTHPSESKLEVVEVVVLTLMVVIFMVKEVLLMVLMEETIVQLLHKIPDLAAAVVVVTMVTIMEAEARAAPESFIFASTLTRRKGGPT